MEERFDRCMFMKNHVLIITKFSNVFQMKRKVSLPFAVATPAAIPSLRLVAAAAGGLGLAVMLSLSMLMAPERMV